MLSFGNERTIQQGEAWNLDILLSQSSTEYIPFIVSSERSNPLFAITVAVASSKYDKNQEYIVTHWLSMDELPKFYQTTPVSLGEIATGTPISKPSIYDGIDVLFQYTKEEDIILSALGHKPYYYVYFVDNEPIYDYECRIIDDFTTEETSKWEGQNYLYQITLVDTVLMADYVNDAHDAYPTLKWIEWIENPEREDGETDEDYLARTRELRNEWILDNIDVLFPFIKARIPTWFQVDIESDFPVGYIGASQVILTPTKLQVNNNLRKII